MPPASSRPRVVALATQPYPRDMIGNILKQLLMSTHDPRQVCKGVVALRGLSRSWRGDDTNLYKLGCEALSIPPQRDATHEYRFKQACRELRKFMAQPLDERTLHLDPEDPGYHAFGWYYRTEVDRYAGALSFVPRTRPEFLELARNAVERDGGALRYVPDDLRPALVRLAVTTSYWALQWVRPEDHPDDYSEVARLAVSADWEAFQYVSKTHPAFGDIARVAVTTKPFLIRHVPPDHSDFGSLVRIAVQDHGEHFRHVPHTHPEYCQIALLAVRSDAEKGRTYAFYHLESQHCSNEELAAMARLALAIDGNALYKVPTGHPNYAELAEIAVKQSPYALREVGVKEHEGDSGCLPDEYYRIARLAIEKDPMLIYHVESLPYFSESDRRSKVSDGYARIARLAVKLNVASLQHVDSANDDKMYDEIARFAIERDPTAIRYVDHDIEVYDILARFAIQRDERARPHVRMDRLS